MRGGEVCKIDSVINPWTEKHTGRTYGKIVIYVSLWDCGGQSHRFPTGQQNP
jgi:hypothetical protein